MRSIVVYLSCTALYFSIYYKTSGFKVEGSPIIYILSRSKPILRSETSVTSEPPLRAGGMFGSFLRVLFESLIDFPKTDGKYDRRLTRYITVLAECLYEMRYDYAKRLARRLEKLSRMHEEDIKDVLKNYIEDVEEKLPHRIKFLNAMSSIFMPEQQLHLYDYVLEVRDYGKMDKMVIKNETRYVLNDVIMKRIWQLSSSDRRKLKEKLRKAIKEYAGWSYSSLMLSDESSDQSLDLSSDYESSRERKHKHHKHNHKEKHKYTSDSSDYSDDSFERKVLEIITKHDKSKNNTKTKQFLTLDP